MLNSTRGQQAIYTLQLDFIFVSLTLKHDEN